MTAETSIPFAQFLGCAARVFGVFALLPLGWDLIGFGQRMTIVAAITIFLMPIVANAPAPGMLDYPIEFLIGMLLALPAALIVECASTAGELFDTLRGQTLATAYDPLQQQSIPLSGTLAKFALWALLLSAGTALHLVEGISVSFSAIPLGALHHQELTQIGRNVLLYIPDILTQTCAACLPFAAACLACEAIFAVMSRQLPGPSFQTEGTLAKLLIAVTLVTAALDGGAFDLLPEYARPIAALVRTQG